MKNQKIVAIQNFFNNHSQKLIVNIDVFFMLPSLTSMIHQFYIGNNKHWQRFDVSSLFNPRFQCFLHIEANDDLPSSKL